MKRVQFFNFLILLTTFHGLFASRFTMLKPITSTGFTLESLSNMRGEQYSQSSHSQPNQNVVPKYYAESYSQKSAVPVSKLPSSPQSSHNISYTSFNTNNVDIAKALYTKNNNLNSMSFPKNQSVSSILFNQNSLKSPLDVSLQSPEALPSASNLLYGDKKSSQQTYQQTYPMYRSLFDSTGRIQSSLTNKQIQKPFSLLDLIQSKDSLHDVQKISNSVELPVLSTKSLVLDNKLESLEKPADNGRFTTNQSVTTKQPTAFTYNDGSVIDIAMNQNAQSVFSFVNISKNFGLRYIAGRNPILELGFKDAQGKNSIITITDPTLLTLENQNLVKVLPDTVQKELANSMKTQAVQDILNLSYLPFDELQSLKQSLDLVPKEKDTVGVYDAHKNTGALGNVFSKRTDKNDFVIEENDLVRQDHQVVQPELSTFVEKIPGFVDKEIQIFADKAFDSLPANSSRFAKILAILERIQEMIIQFIQSIGAFDEAAYQRTLLENAKKRMAVNLSSHTIDKLTWLEKIQIFMDEIWQILLSKFKEDKQSVDVSENSIDLAE